MAESDWPGPCFAPCGAGAKLEPMSGLTPQEVAKLADLARLDLTDDELTKLTGDLGGILAAVAKITEVAADDVPATSHPIYLRNITRPDEPRGGLNRDEVLACAPAAEDGRFRVPRILDEE